MNAYERITARMAGKPVDRIPNLNIFMMMPAKQLGIPYGAYVTDYRKLVQGVLYCHEQFDTDCLCVISDPMREAEGMGAKVVVPEDGVPYSPEPFLKEVRISPRSRSPRPPAAGAWRTGWKRCGSCISGQRVRSR